MDLHKAIRIRAYRAVTGPLTRDYMYRRIMRWYSKTFSTPLSQVEEFPVEDVLQVYYEETYEEMDEEQRQGELSLLLQTDEDLLEARAEEDEFDLEAWTVEREIAKEEKKKEAKKTELKLKQSSSKIANVEPQRLINEVQKSSSPWDDAPASPQGMSMSFDLDVDEDLLSEDFGPMTGIKKR